MRAGQESDLRAENESVSDIRLMRAGQESDQRAENEKFNM